MLGLTLIYKNSVGYLWKSLRNFGENAVKSQTVNIRVRHSSINYASDVCSSISPGNYSVV